MQLLLLPLLRAIIQQRESSTVSNKPNHQFTLTIRDVEIIEQALRAKAGRRGMSIATGETSPQLREEMTEIQELLGRIHNQKNHYAKFTDGRTYVSG